MVIITCEFVWGVYCVLVFGVFVVVVDCSLLKEPFQALYIETLV